MYKFLSLIVLLPFFAWMTPAQAYSVPQPEADHWQWGTQVHIELRDRLTTRRDERGESFDAVLASDLYHRHRLIARAGTRVRGLIVHLQEGQQRPQKIRAEMNLVLNEINIDGQWIPMSTKAVRLQSSRDFTALKVLGPTVAGGALLGLKGAAAGSLLGLGWAVITKDRQIVLRRKTQLQFRVQRPGRLRRMAQKACDCD